MAEESPALKRDSTMAVTAKVRNKVKRSIGFRQVIDLCVGLFRREKPILKSMAKFTKMRRQELNRKNLKKPTKILLAK